MERSRHVGWNFDKWISRFRRLSETVRCQSRLDTAAAETISIWFARLYCWKCKSLGNAKRNTRHSVNSPRRFSKQFAAHGGCGSSARPHSKALSAAHRAASLNTDCSAYALDVGGKKRVGAVVFYVYFCGKGKMENFCTFYHLNCITAKENYTSYIARMQKQSAASSLISRNEGNLVKFNLLNVSFPLNFLHLSLTFARV